MANTSCEEAATAIAAALADAWNAADGAAFAREFTDDADFVNIFAFHGVGREAIAKQHDMIFTTIYRGSHSTFTVKKVRSLGDDAGVALIVSELDVPQGPMAGKLRALATTVLVRDGDRWKIASFHNTREQALPAVEAAR
jgi:uncharacterized protein (TIGR02246 family)